MARMQRTKSFSQQVKASQCELLGTKIPLKLTKTHLKHFGCLSDP